MATDVWRRRSQLDDLRGLLDPADSRGAKNRYIDFIHRAALARWCVVKRDEVVLDFGCGRGRLASALASQARQVWGLDLVWEMLQMATKRHSLDNFVWVVGQGGALPWGDATFDKVLTVYVLQHILDQNTLASVLLEFSRVLKHGGQVILLEQMRSKQTRTIENYVTQRTSTVYQLALEQAGLRVATLQPLRAHSLLTHLIASGVVPQSWFSQVARLDAALAGSARFSFPYNDYLLLAEKTI